jgi:FkbM family methyltransferase
MTAPLKDIWDAYPSIIEGSPDPVVLEIGVGRGEDTGRMVDWLVGTGKPFRYFAFEPEVKNLPAIRALPCARHVTLIAAAIGDHDGETEFIGSGTWPLSGSVKQPKEHRKSYPWIPWQPPVLVPIMRLDTFAAIHQLDEITFIWADLQGAEDLLIAGGQKALAKTRHFYSEFYSTPEYEGQIGLDEIHRRLPGKWERVEVWPGDIPGSGNVLFRNTDFKP